MRDNSTANPVAVIVGLLIAGGTVWFYLGGGFERQVQSNLNDVHRVVAEDAEKQYLIAQRSGTALDAYVHAGLVAAAYLQAKDEPNYKKWKAIEASEADRAGMKLP